ncbi:MAG: PepSY domain-containing protein [Myxococcales bacterium]|nr:PepSY domain-containing protein [Myxococcales bacterium]
MTIDNFTAARIDRQTSTSVDHPQPASRGRLAVRIRKFAIIWHRYVGLAISVFLIVAGSTGVLLAFNHELDAWLTPELFEASPTEPGQALLDPMEVQRRAQSHLPEDVELRTAHFSVIPGRSLMFWDQDALGQWRQWFINPYTGEPLGSRTWGHISEGKQNLMPFIYRLHYSLGLGVFGALIFGIAAILWTFDCFFAIYLTFPPPSNSQASMPKGKRRPWITRWKTSWLVRAKQMFTFIFTWHRASGLWIWGFLLIFAWSAVSLNLPQVYGPVVNAVVGMKVVGHGSLPHLSPPFPKPKLTLEQAYARGRIEMAREASERDFKVLSEQQIYWAADHGIYGYVVESTLDLSHKSPSTEVYIDGQTGKFVSFAAPTGIAAGNTFSSWIVALHMATVFGLWYQIVVAIVGLMVTVLSITGVWIWWRKRVNLKTPKTHKIRSQKEPISINPPSSSPQHTYTRLSLH